MPRFLRAAFGLLTASVVLLSGVGLAADPFWGADPAWSLIHEPAVERELKLSPAKSRDFRRLLDECDARFFPLRNKPLEEAAKGATEAMAELTKNLQSLLSEPQLRRLAEIQTRQQGTSALLRTGLASLMDYTPQQKEQLEQAVSETLAKTKEFEQRAANGEPREPLEKQYTALKQDELKTVIRTLSPTQKSIWQESLGRDFDLTKLGQARFKAPELVDSGVPLLEILRLQALGPSHAKSPLQDAGGVARIPELNGREISSTANTCPGDGVRPWRGGSASGRDASPKSLAETEDLRSGDRQRGSSELSGCS